ncbi:MAG TPA: hypothetical protein VMU94_20535 [Streptosporangiaceae bacterium]|nr:hypothetical protein [Streptosporangiaceae bacterium]
MAGQAGSVPGAGFDPLELTTEASLNRVVIGNFGCPEVAGRRAEDACSRDAFCALAADCGLPGLRPGRLSDDLASAAASADAHAARAATAALVIFGRRLGALIATLRDPRTRDEQAGTPVRRAYLSYWLTVDSVWLAGGLLAGSCGHIITRAARAGAAAAARPCRVALTLHPAVAPLVGAARRGSAMGIGELVAVADLGHTSIRTAVAERSTAALTGLRLIDARAAPSRRSPDEVEDAVADALADVVRRAARARSRRVRVMVSIASCVTAGVPVDEGASVYGSLAGRVASLRRRVTADSGADAILEFVHDGTAAASAAGSANSATITAGTWLGVGFQPAQAAPLLELAPDLRIGRD